MKSATDKMRVICKLINQHIDIRVTKENQYYFVTIQRLYAGYSSLQYQKKHNKYSNAKRDYYEKLKSIDEAYSSQILEAMGIVN